MSIRGVTFEKVLTTRALAAMALVLGGLAAVAGRPRPNGDTRVDIDELAHAVEHEEDHVSALQLAQWIRDKRPGVRVIDVRSDSEYIVSHIPSAEWVPLTKLRTTRFDTGETVVLYSEGGVHAAQGWFFLRASGLRHVYFLQGGLEEWEDAVLRPQLAGDATPAQRAAFDAAMPLSHYFGGIPTVNVPDRADKANPRTRRRRWC
jgi:rhodanese-related sulfurtransferase